MTALNYEQYEAEMSAFEKKVPRWQIEMPTELIIAIIAALQLADSHPNMPESIRVRNKAFVDGCKASIPPEYTMIHEVIRKGWER